jgi:UDP-glucose 4-epimerase
MAHYLVTGGAGFIGSNIVAELVQRGEQVRVLDNFSTGNHENLAALRQDIACIEGDIRDLDAVHQAMQGITYVLHQAALPSVPRSIDDPLTSNEVNITGTLNVLLAARDAGTVQRVVCAASSSAYGDTEELPKHERMPNNPLSPYAIGKLTGEYYCKVFAEVYGLPTTSLRYFNIFGPHQDPQSEYAAVVPKFITRMMRGERPTIYGDGLQSRDFTAVANAVEANLLACTHGTETGQVYNVGCGEQYTLLDLIEALKSLLQVDIEPIFEPARPGDVKHSLASITRIQEAIGYQVQENFQAGLARAVAWYRGKAG